VILVILSPFSVWYVCKLDSWAHILRGLSFGLKTGCDRGQGCAATLKITLS
jgi:hypothetical protein